MTVGELIEKLSKLPPSTVVALDGEFGYDAADLDVYRFRGVVRRSDYGNVYVYDDNSRDDVETVALISVYGQDDDKEML